VTDWLVVLNAALLLGCASIYLGTGVTMVFFQHPGAGQLTPDNYYEQFFPQVHLATRFFTVMTNVMLVSAGLMCWSEWATGYLAVPIAEIVLVGLATVVTVRYIFRYNDRMEAGITDPTELTVVLRRWMRLNVVRVSIWALEWLVIAAWFVGQAR
jgi:hypothetical protein